MAGFNRFVLPFLVLLSFAGVSQASFVTNLTDVQIQAILQNYFPLREYASIARIALLEPKVQLEKDHQDIVLMIPVEANITGDALRQGHVTLLVNVNYQSASGDLFLSNPRLQQFEMPGVDDKVLAELREIIIAMGKSSLPLVRIYTVNETDLNHSLAKSALKDFQVEENQIRLEFGFK